MLIKDLPWCSAVHASCRGWQLVLAVLRRGDLQAMVQVFDPIDPAVVEHRSVGPRGAQVGFADARPDLGQAPA